MRYNTIMAALAAAAVLGSTGAARAAVPVVSNVEMQQMTGTRNVRVTYTLEDAAAIVTLSIETNGVAIPDSAVTRLSGAVCKEVAIGTGHTITWNAGADWPEHVTATAKARVTAWSLDAPPQYCAVNVIGGSSALLYPIYYYLSAEGVPGGVTNDLYKTTQILMRQLPPTDGSFKMGSPSDEIGRNAAKEAQVDVSLSKAYYAGVYQVTQYQWERVMEDWPSYFSNNEYRHRRPLEMRSWDDIRGGDWPGEPAGTGLPANSTFIKKLRDKTEIFGFDLPTEAQWEYACRAGTTGALNDGTVNLTNSNSDARLDLLGRYKVNGGFVGGVPSAAGCGPENGTAIVGSYLPNYWGLYDMHGNVWEWCLDWYGTLEGGANPKGLGAGSTRVIRGGGWSDTAMNCRSARRDGITPSLQYNDVGFRLVRTLP